MSSMTPEKRALLKQILQKKGISAGLETAIPRRQAEDLEPASLLQEGLWFLDQLDPGKATYNVPGATRISGPLNKAALEQTLTEIVRRHEVLRTNFRTVDGRPVQKIETPSIFFLDIIDLSTLDADEREAEMHRLATEEARRPFELAKGPLFRAFLVCMAAEEHVFVLNLHHIVTDGWSMGVFTRELCALYEAFADGKPNPLPELPIQFADFAIWEKRRLRGNYLERQLAFWRTQLHEPLPVLNIPTDKPRPSFQTCNGRHETLALPVQLSDALKNLTKREETTLFELLLAAFMVHLSYYSGQDDIIVGSPVANRHLKELEPLIGYFVNMLPLRADLSGDPTFPELIERVRKATMAAYMHQELPFGKIVEELGLSRDVSRNPVFQVEFILLTQEHAPAVYGYGFRSPIKEPLTFSDLRLTPIDIESGVAKFDLVVLLWDVPEGISGTFEYNADLFLPRTIKGMIKSYMNLLTAVVATPDERLSGLKRKLTSGTVSDKLPAKAGKNANVAKLKTMRQKISTAMKREDIL